MNKGWIKLHRKITKWEWSDDPNVLALFVHILLNANFEEKNWRGQQIKPGQMIIGIYSLSKKTGISPQSLRTALNKLISTGEIIKKSTNRFSIITVINWRKYQGQEKNQQTTNKQLTTPKECKEGKEVIVSNETEVKTINNITTKRMELQYTPVDDEGNDVTISPRGKKRVIYHEPYIFKQELDRLREAPQKMYKIIAQYWHNKPRMKFENRQQHELQLSRDVKIAKKLEGYNGVQIQKGIDYCKERFDDWTLETVGRYLPEVINEND